MEKTKLSSKGQVVLPRAIRAAKAWRTGQPLSLDDVVGCLRYKGKAKTIEEMHAAVTKEARRRGK